MRINQLDNVDVHLEDGHKYANRKISEGENIIKYGFPIGHATCPIAEGEHVHVHNMRTNLKGELSYVYRPVKRECTREEPRHFYGYLRKNGEVGIRNDIWIVNTVGCVNKTAELIARRTGAKFFPHPFGCSQLGDDHERTQLILKGLVQHPNAGGVLVLGLGCENNHIGAFRKMLGKDDMAHIRFLNVQDVEDEIAEGINYICELEKQAETCCRERIPVSKLKIGLKCGGSDAFSGLTANPLVGRVADRFTAQGAAVALTEVPEMFGAEHLLMERCVNQTVFDKTVRMINGFKAYFANYGQPVYENPSPGNKAGGITTLEEKSLGCVQKGGQSPVVDVLGYGQKISKAGLSLLDGPGNDMVAVTNLAAAGAQMILFTTGRGTPLGGPVPTLKISSNRTLAEKKKGWIDFDASPILEGEDLTEKLFEKILQVAEGYPAKNEQNGYEEIAIFKDGVTL